MRVWGGICLGTPLGSALAWTIRGGGEHGEEDDDQQGRGGEG